jgi:Domain of unknown function (DUF6249)
MAPEILGVMIPIIFILVTGLVIVTIVYFRSREKQMLIEKGLDATSIKEFFENKKDPYLLMKIGIIAVAFGIGLGIGLILQDSTSKDYWIPLFIFTFTGLGFIIANLVAKKPELKQ